MRHHIFAVAPRRSGQTTGTSWSSWRARSSPALGHHKPPRMELRQLESFLVVAELLHFRRAAGRVHLSQPALSRQIQHLSTSSARRCLNAHQAG